MVYEHYFSQGHKLYACELCLDILVINLRENGDVLSKSWLFISLGFLSSSDVVLEGLLYKDSAAP